MPGDIGGYFEMDFNMASCLHQDALELNTARNCFEYILLAKKIEKIYIPHYTCGVMLEPLKRHDVKYIYYNLDENMAPILPASVDSSDYLLYTNYFGIKQDIVEHLSLKYKNLIIDNSMAFYAPRKEKLDTFYSARKFFGVSDGAYLYTEKKLELEFEEDLSHTRMLHLFKRIELGANEAYQNFLDDDLSLYDQPIRRMSPVTKRILLTTDQLKYKAIRERNFLFLHHQLEYSNELKIGLTSLCGPMFYPFLYDSVELRAKLIENKIYVPMLWKNALETAESNSFEHYLTKNLFALPIDQRYSLNDMQFILDKIQLQ